VVEGGWNLEMSSHVTMSTIDGPFLYRNERMPMWQAFHDVQNWNCLWVDEDGGGEASENLLVVAVVVVADVAAEDYADLTCFFLSFFFRGLPVVK